MEPIKTLWIRKVYSSEGLYDLYLFNGDLEINNATLDKFIPACLLSSQSFPELNLKDYETAKIEMIITKVEAE